MKHTMILSAMLFFSIGMYAQQEYVDGYFIDNNNKRVECLVINLGGKKTPEEFSYKLNPASQPIVSEPSGVREFGITGGLRFISAEVQIDISSDDDNVLSDEKIPQWRTRRLFLSVIVDGEASLYMYANPATERYFYKTSVKPLAQLVYRRYVSKTGVSSTVVTDNTFRRQLWEDVRTPNQPITSVESIEYEKEALANYFMEFDRSGKVTFHTYARKSEPAGFHLIITPGVQYSSLKITNNYGGSPDFDFGGQFGFRIGVETELIIPYTHKKFALFLEPGFYYFKGSQTSMGQTMTAEFYNVEMPFGMRYYFYAGKNTNIFIEGLINTVFCIPVNSEIKYEGEENLDTRNGFYFAPGAGMNWKWLGAGIRYYTPQKIVNTNYLTGKYSRIALILRFRVF